MVQVHVTPLVTYLTRHRCHRGGGFLTVKKVIALVVLGLGAFAIWRKVQADRAELDLWTEATTADEN